VYLVGLTRLSVGPRWWWHIRNLIRKRIDLKYDFLKKLARDVDLQTQDTDDRFEAKLAPFRLATISWALAEIKSHGRRRGARVVVVLIPTAEEPTTLAEYFVGVGSILRELDLPVIDLLDTFVGVQDVYALRTEPGNVHPNQRGHEMLFQNFYRKLLADPELFSQFTGRPRSAPEEHGVGDSVRGEASAHGRG
jgi:hypothetical protein